MIVRRLHGEGIGNAVSDAALPHLCRVELEHLGRCVGGDQLIGVLGQQAGPLAGPGGELQDPAAWPEGAQRRANTICRVRERIGFRR